MVIIGPVETEVKRRGIFLGVECTEGCNEVQDLMYGSKYKLYERVLVPTMLVGAEIYGCDSKRKNV